MLPAFRAAFFGVRGAKIHPQHLIKCYLDHFMTIPLER
jgi:hypothetical protein